MSNSRKYGNIGTQSAQCLIGLYRKHFEYSSAPAGVDALPVPYAAPAGPAMASGLSGGASTARRPSNKSRTGEPVATSAANPFQSPLKPPSEHDSPEENTDHDVDDNIDDDNFEDADNNSNQDPADEENEEDDEEGFAEEEKEESLEGDQAEVQKEGEEEGQEEGQEEEQEEGQAENQPTQPGQPAPLPNSIVSKTYKGVLIELCVGDIAHFPSANPKGPPYARILVTDAAIELDGSGGADDEAIHTAAGPLLKDALTALKRRKEYGNERTRVWTTGSCNLGLIGVRRIIHAVGPLCHPRASDEENSRRIYSLYDTYRNVLKEAIRPENNRANMMVVFSLISTNKNNFEPEGGTGIALEQVRNFIDDGKIGGINHIVFVVPRVDDERVKPFEDAMRYVDLVFVHVCADFPTVNCTIKEKVVVKELQSRAIRQTQTAMTAMAVRDPRSQSQELHNQPEQVPKTTSKRKARTTQPNQRRPRQPVRKKQKVPQPLQQGEVILKLASSKTN